MRLNLHKCATSCASHRYGMAITEGIPLFDHDFDGFLAFLRDDLAPTSISPSRYAHVMGLDMQTLAVKAHVHQSIITHDPETEGMQRYLRESLRVIREAVDVAGSVEKAIFWFKNNPIPVFNYTTPLDLVTQGRANDLIRYAQSLQAGFSG